MSTNLRAAAIAIVFIGMTALTSAQFATTPQVNVTATIEQPAQGSAVLVIRAAIAPGLHIYAQTQPKPFLATKFTVDPSESVASIGDFVANKAPLVVQHETLGVELYEHEGQVEWRAALRTRGDPQEPLEVRGTLFAQACEEDRCFAPKKYAFVARLAIPPAASATRGDASAATMVAPSDTRREFALDRLKVTSSAGESALRVLPLAFVAGFLLNFMPCVLPVVGLKLLSFVQQANSDRKRILMMNVAYTGGILAVMAVLATLAVFAGLGWGEQFSSAAFTVTLSAIVFAFGLSFLGVWEIPLPGFVGDAGAAKQEGYAGAFSKGILSTLLATPCSGPFLGAALAWAVTQPTHLTYSVFAMVGLGMASPYLVVGLFPATIRFLPKPGNWMVTFKQVMGFVMLGTLVYLMSFMPIAAVVPTLLLLLGIGVALWYAGQTPIYAETRHQLIAWSVAAAITAVATFASFGWLHGVMQSRFERAALRLVADASTPNDLSGETALSNASAISKSSHGIAWENYTPARLEQLVRAGTPVFVDFTADWCLTCKANESVAIETPEFAAALQKGQVVALRADKTEPNAEADKLLRQLGNSSASIPFYAFFSRENPNAPTLLDGVYASPQPFVSALDDTHAKSVSTKGTASGSDARLRLR